MPLIKDTVTSYLQSKNNFINRIKQVMLNANMKFGSLDIFNLDGSLPLEDD